MAVVVSARAADLLLGRANGGVVDLQTGVRSEPGLHGVIHSYLCREPQ